MGLDVGNGLIIGIGSTLSLIGTVFVILSWVLFNDQRVYSRKLILFLCASQLGIVVGLILSFITSTGQTGQALCQLQAYIIIFFLLYSYTWTACFASHLFELLYRKVKRSNPNEYLYHFISLLIPCLVCCFYVVVSSFSSTPQLGDFDRPYCFISASQIPYSTATSTLQWFIDDGLAQQMMFIYAPYTLILLYNIVIYGVLMHKVNGTAMGHVIQLKLLSYILALLLCGAPALANRSYEYFWEQSECNSVLLVLENIELPLHGFFTAIFYGMNARILQNYKDIMCYRKQVQSINSDYSQLEAGQFRTALTQPLAVSFHGWETHKEGEEKEFLTGRSYNSQDGFDAADYASITPD